MSLSLQANSASAAAAHGVSAQYLTFALGSQVFAMEISNIREIVQQTEMTAVPLMPDFIRGILNLRGAVVPVIDLQVRFGRPRSHSSKKTCIVIFESTQHAEKTELGLQVDAVSEVVEIAASDVEPPPQFGATINRDFIRGMGKVKGEYIVILEPDRALDMNDLTQLVQRSQSDSVADIQH